MIARYADVTDGFEIWNEPSLTASNYESYAQLAATVCTPRTAAHRRRCVAGAASPPKLSYGVLSGGFAVNV